MKAFFTHFSTYSMLLLSLVALLLAIVSSQQSHLTTPNPCLPKQRGTVYPVAETCTSFIYCHEGTAIKMLCPLGDGFSTEAKGCLNMEKSDCAQINPTSTTPDDCKKNEHSSESKAQCVDQPPNARRPYVGDCTKFLICDCEYPTTMSCTNGLWFNPKLSACDSPQNVDCPWTTTSLKTLTTEAISASDKEESSTESMEVTTSTVQATISVEPACLNRPNNSIFPINDNCTHFIFCQDGVATLHSCPKGFLFDADLLICQQDHNDQTEDVNCSRANSREATPGELCVHHQPGSALPYHSSCESYIFCGGNGHAIVLKCPADKYFDPVTETCVAGTSPTACGEKRVLHPRICSETSVREQIVAHPYNCRQYISCSLPVPMAFECASNTTFNPKTIRCEIPIDDDCKLEAKRATNTPPFTVCNGIPDNDTIPHVENRQFYIRCHGSLSYMIESCDMQEFYDPASQSCRVDGPLVISDSVISTETSPISSTPHAHPSMGIEKSNALTESEETTALSDQTTSEETILHSTETTLIESGTNQLATTSVTSLLCHDKLERAFFPHPDVCNMYISCHQTNATIHICPTGLEFSTKILSCVHPDDSDCSKDGREPMFPNIYEGNICCGKPLGTLLPYPNDMARFIVCQYPVPAAYSCPEGTFYSSDGEQCSVNSSASRRDELTTIAPVKSSTGITDPGFQRISVITADPFNASTSPTYNMESSSEPFGNSWESSTETSSPSSIDTATTLLYPLPNKYSDATSICKGQSYGSQLPFVGSCTKYYFCLGKSRGEVFECVSGWYFDPKKRLCVSPSSYRCPW